MSLTTSKTGIGLFEEAMKSFLTSCRVKGLSLRTIKWYEYVLNEFRKYVEEPLENITKETIQNYLLLLKDKGFKKTTLANRYRGLRAFFNYLAEEEIIFVNPIQGVKPPKLPKVFPNCLSDEEVDKLIKALKGSSWHQVRNRAIVLLFLETGIRLRELRELKLRDINLSRHEIKARGKGEKERIVFFGRRVLEALKKWLSVRGGILTVDEPLFITQDGLPMKDRHIERIVSKAAKKAGITKRVSPHTLRHTFATLFIKNGGDVFTLQRLLGHSDVSTCMIYVNMAGRDLKESALRFSPIDRLYY